MDKETSKEFIKDLTVIIKLLKSENPTQEEINTKINALYTKADEMNDSLLSGKHILRIFSVLLVNFVEDLRSKEIDISNKILIANGLIPFINDFLDETKKETLYVTDVKNKKTYLKMIDVAYPLVAKQEISSEIVSNNLTQFKNYLFAYRDIISTFPIVDGYDEFKKTTKDFGTLISNNELFTDNKLTSDLMNKIQKCFKFISEIKAKVEAEAKEKDSSSFTKFFKKFWTYILAVLFILITFYFVKDFIFSNSKSVLKQQK